MALARLLMERVDGIEPTRPLWKSGVLPLNYTRKHGGSFAQLPWRSSLC